MSSALISPCGKYRYWLTRHWGKVYPRVIWIMLNPSTADASIDDHTIRKCIGFTKRWGYEALTVINLFAFRATSPKDLKKAEDPFGPENKRWQRTVLTLRLSKSDLIVAGWGTHGTLLNAGDDFKTKLEEEKIIMCLGLTKNGQPKHPLMMSYDTPLIPLPR